MELIKEDLRGKVYQGKGFKLFYRKKNSVSGDNSTNAEEFIYLIEGSARATLEDKVQDLKSPSEIHFPASTYHKIEALTDIVFLLLEK